MRINTNISSLSAQRQMSQTTRALGRALARLSSGKRITEARDDAAGLAIGERLSSQVRGLRQIALNINQAFGYLNTADSILATQTDIVQRMKELAVQGANGTLSSSDRKMLETELLTLLEEFDRVSNQANFNGTNLLDGTLQDIDLQVGLQKGETIGFSLEDSRATAIFTSVSTVGTGTFSEGQTIQDPQSPYIFGGLGDINADGKNDFLLLSELDGAFSAFISQENGEFERTYLGYGQVDFGDINGDGLSDYVGMFAAGVIEVYLQDGDGNFSLNNTFTSNFGSLEDYDSDGDLDFVATTALSGLQVTLNQNGSLNQTATASASFDSYPTRLDINGDGILDATAIDGINQTIAVALGRADGSFSALSTLTLPSGYTSIRWADFNGDGYKDIVGLHSSNGTAVVRLGSSTGTFSAGQTLSLGAGFDTLWETQDVNEDGFDDLFVLNDSTETLSIRLSDGAGGFTAAQTLDLNGYGLSYNLGEDHFEDLDGDGHIDLIAHNNFVDLKIFWGQGNGAFNQQSTLAMLGGGFLNGFKDLNGDGLMDIVSAPDGFSLTVTTPAFALNNGDRTFTGGQLSVDTFGAVLIDDFSGDGIDDYLMSQPSAVYDNLISIYVQNTESTESAVTISMQSQAEAQDLLEVFDRALQKLSERRARIGATTSRLESALAGTNIAMENLSGAKSQILDVDIASETAELTRLQILQQAQASVLLQANSNLPIALSLLRP